MGQISRAFFSGWLIPVSCSVATHAPLTAFTPEKAKDLRPWAAKMAERDWLRLPVVSAGAEFLVMGYLMRRNILAYKAPPHNEGYDLICIHPNPRHRPGPGELSQVRV